MRFDELELEDSLLQGLDAMNFQETTPIQELTIPVILEGKDLIACAQTGTGKTAAYTLPILNRLIKEENRSDTVKAVIMAPGISPTNRCTIRGIFLFSPCFDSSRLWGW